MRVEFHQRFGVDSRGAIRRVEPTENPFTLIQDMRFSLFSVVALVTATIAIVVCGCGSRDASTSLAAAPRTAVPLDNRDPLTLTDLDSVPHAPFAKSEVVAHVLVFTMLDCPNANSYVPTLNELSESYKERGVHFVLVHVDPELTTNAARKHAEEYQIKAPVVIDRRHAWVDRAGATRTPEAAVFSRDGKLLYRGRIDNRYAALGKRRTHVTVHDLRDALDAILAGQPVAQTKTEAVGCIIPRLPTGE